MVERSLGIDYIADGRPSGHYARELRPLSAAVSDFNFKFNFDFAPRMWSLTPDFWEFNFKGGFAAGFAG